MFMRSTSRKGKREGRRGKKRKKKRNMKKGKGERARKEKNSPYAFVDARINLRMPRRIREPQQEKKGGARGEFRKRERGGEKVN